MTTVTTHYARINAPVAYGDIDESAKTLEEWARENVDIVGLDEEEYDYEIFRHPNHGDSTVTLQTLFKIDPENPTDRILRSCRGELASSVEYGTREYFSHIWDSWTVEDDHIAPD